MSKWDMVRLGDVCDNAINTIKSSDTGLIDYIDIASVDNASKNIIGYQTYEIEDAPSRAKQIIRHGDILISTVRPNLNAVAMNRLDSENMQICSTGFCVLRPTEQIDGTYLFHYCQSPVFVESLSRQATGASYPAVNNTIVRNCKIPFPVLPVQQRIAAILDCVNPSSKKARRRLRSWTSL
jgi:type I restriction enzyme S subunit